jgi:hypothetical protein
MGVAAGSATGVSAVMATVAVTGGVSAGEGTLVAVGSGVLEASSTSR